MAMRDIINNQIAIENAIDKINLPDDGNIYNAVSQIPHMVSELGEFMQADTRWKQSECKNVDLLKAHAMEELIDVFIMAVNLMLSYGMSEEMIIAAYNHKLEVLESRHKIPKGELTKLKWTI